MLEILTDASKLKTARLANSGEMDYRHLPVAVRDVLATWDTDGSNSCLFDERVGGLMMGGWGLVRVAAGARSGCERTAPSEYCGSAVDAVC